MWPDLLVAAIVVWYAVFAVRRGFVAVMMSLVAFIAAFVVSFALYPVLAQFMTDHFGWSPVWSRPVAFVGLWLTIELLFSWVARLISSRMSFNSQRFQANQAL